MSDNTQDLEIFRERFLDQLHKSQIDLAHHQEFVAYWRSVEQQAEMTTELDRLENWVRDLARDKDRVKALEARLESQDRENPMIANLLQIIRMVLDVLEGIDKKLRKKRDGRRQRLAAILWRAGPGTKPKPDDDDENDETKKGPGAGAAKKPDQQQQANIVGKQDEKGKPKTPPDKAKKLER
jgi:hypothetical protein